jgi:S-methylmethionine-dependent homocysteine/selenocysteine methylase
MGLVDELNRRLADGEVVIVDGGMGTELQARGVPMTHEAWCGLANIDHKDVVRQIHEDYIGAGADVHITNTYASARFMLDLAGCGDRVGEINRRAVEAALEARERVAERPVFIAGSISPVWGVREAREKGFLDESGDALLDAFRELAAILVEAGVDLLILETFTLPELPAGLKAALETGVPVWLGATAGLDQGELVMSLPDVNESFPRFTDGLRAMLDSRLSAVTVMHTELEPVPPALEVVQQCWDGPFGAYPHIGTYSRPIWNFTDMSPEEYAAHAATWVGQGAQLVGGCCGVRPDHIRALKERLPDRVPRPPSGG